MVVLKHQDGAVRGNEYLLKEAGVCVIRLPSLFWLDSLFTLVVHLIAGTRHWNSYCCPALQHQSFSEGGEGPEPAKISEGRSANRKESSG